MNSFNKQIIVSNKHIDNLNHVNNIKYLKWAQNIAKAHWNYLIKDLDNEFGLWVVRHHDVKYRLSAKLGDIIQISTYVNNIRGPLSERIVQFKSTENKIIVEVKTQWCYIKNNKPVNIPNIIIDLFKVSN
ncbi:MAG: thioesterase [Flavobacteriaceae bacterium]|nr:thioesterase [Flavobacteriaceae bacterium]|tara:strand:- start:6435 stop:6824 length:390 start_codon:yes stop_codon:yes gene_type:complete